MQQKNWISVTVTETDAPVIASSRLVRVAEQIGALSVT
jgi:hypothetical protein